MKQLLDDQSYNVMLCFLDNQHFIEKPADESNLIFLKNDWWLSDTAVIDSIIYKKGAGRYTLPSQIIKKPLQLIVRKISRCYSEDKANIAAHYMRRLAAKDQRGTLSVTIKDLNLCTN